MKSPSWLRYARIVLTMLVAILGVAAAGQAQTAGAPQLTSGGPQIYLRVNQVLPVEHVGPKHALEMLKSGQVESLSLAQGDFHETGIPDLAVGYATSGGNFVALHQGNLDAFAPQSRESWEAIRNGIFPAPFHLQASVIEAPERPDFLEAGTFTRQGHVDLAMAARGGRQIYILPGNGQGQFRTPLSIPVSGTITALAAGQLGPNSPFTAIAVGVRGTKGSRLLVYRGSASGLVNVASLAMEGPPTQIALGDLNGNGSGGAAILADGHVFLVDWGSQGEPMLRPSGLPGSIAALAVGRFLFDRNPQQQLALLGRDGNIYIAAHEALDGRSWTPEEGKVMRAHRGKPNPFIHPPAFPNQEGWKVFETFVAVAPFSGTNHPVLLRAHISSRGADDVMVVNGEIAQMSIISHPNVKARDATYAPGEQSVMAYSGGRPVAGLAMRVNVDGRLGLIMLHEGEVSPRINHPLPDPTFTVNTTADTVDANPGDGICADSTGKCSLRAAIMEANADPGSDTIMVPAGTFQLTLPPNSSNDGSGGRLVITDSVSIVGTANTDNTPGTIIEAGTSTSNGIDKVLTIDPLPASGTPLNSINTSMSNVVCQFGLDNDPGNPSGGCFDADAGLQGTGTVSLTNVLVQNNSTALPEQGADGGGVAFFTEENTSGAVTISQSIFQGNVTADQGGAIFIGANVPLNMSNSQVLNNKAVAPTPSATGAQQGGGIALPGNAAGTDPQSSIHASSILGNQAGNQGGGIFNGASLVVDTGTIISNNKAVGTGAQTGGGLFSNTINETTTITNATFTGNNAAVSGGAIQVDNGTTGNALNIKFSRIVGNTSPLGNGLNNLAGSVTAIDDWWGCSQGPNTSPCDTVGGSGAVTFAPWITLTNTSSPATVLIGAQSTLTASFLKDSSGATLQASNLGPLIGLPVAWINPVNGSLSGQQTTIMPNGTATATLTTSGTPTASATVQVDHATPTATVNVQDFSIGVCSPLTINVGSGGTVNCTVTVTAISGFTGTVTLSCPTPPAGIQCTFNPPTLPGSGTSTLTLTIPSGIAPGTFTIPVNGTSSGIPPRGANVRLTVADFAVSISPAAPSSIIVDVNQNAVYTVTCSSQTGFNGSVTLSTTFPGSATFSHNPLPCPGSSALTVSSSSTGTFGVHVSGTNGSASRQTNPDGTLQVADFQLSVTPSSRTIGLSGSASYSICTSSLNGFSGTVSFSPPTVSPLGPSAQLSSTSISVGSCTTLTLTINPVTGGASTQVAAGTYTATVTGTGAGVSHSISVTLNVTAPSFILTIDPNQTVALQGFIYLLTIHYSVSFPSGLNGNVSLSLLPGDFCSTGQVPTLGQSTFTSSGTGTFDTWIYDPTGNGGNFYECYRLKGTQQNVNQFVETDIFVTPPPN